jgi:hypothetical protein
MAPSVVPHGYPDDEGATAEQQRDQDGGEHERCAFGRVHPRFAGNRGERLGGRRSHRRGRRGRLGHGGGAFGGLIGAHRRLLGPGKVAGG